MNNKILDKIENEALDKLLKLVYKFTHISMGANKNSMIQGRIRPRIRELNLNSYEDYIDYLNSNKSEIQEFINLMTTNETYFFRTQRVWDYFTKEFLPKWTDENPQKTLRIWSGASSSGEEIYSIGICCEEHRLKHHSFNYQILGTDISSEVLAIAEKGEYGGRSIEAFKSSNRTLFERYLKPINSTHFRIISEVRSHIRFANHNLFDLPKEKNHYDVIFLRNVLIYFEADDQAKVLNNLSLGLIPNGLLIIGESESLASLATPFIYSRPLVYTKGKKENDDKAA